MPKLSIRQRINRNLKNSELRDNEDLPIIDFLETLDKSKEYKLLEIGSGLCRFVDKIAPLYPNIRITCSEINPKLVALAQNKGFSVIQGNFLENKIESESYDIIHCSHVIEHFHYPAITNVLDDFVRIVKTTGTIIIRSPLMWKGFYSDIDHIRPYLPESIINYFTYEQQQKQSSYSIDIKRIWYRTMAKQLKMIDATSIWLLCPPIKCVINFVRAKINALYQWLWDRVRCPATEPNGYVIIFSKLAKQQTSNNT